MDNETKILVLYVNVQGLRSEDIEYYTNMVAKRVIPETFQGEVIVLPVQTTETRIDCINPKYIKDVNLINKHTEMIKELQENLQYQLEQLKNNK